MSRTSRYAVGRKAWAECQRSGKRVYYRDLVEDGNIPGLLVAREWWEPKHPQEFPVDTGDASSLWKPSPEISVTSGGSITALSAAWSPAPQNESIARGALSTTTYTLTAANGYSDYSYVYLTDTPWVKAKPQTATTVRLEVPRNAPTGAIVVMVTGIVIDGLNYSVAETFNVTVTVT